MSESSKQPDQSAEESKWYIGIEGVREGPFSTTEVQKMISDQRVGDTAMVWKQGMADWLPLHEVSEFGGAAPRVGPPDMRSWSRSTLADYLAFRRMITPIIVQALFWVGVLLCVLFALGLLVSAIASNEGGGLLAVFAFLVLLLGPLAVRIYCEMLILFFRMNETLTEIKNQGQGGRQATRHA